MNAGPHSVRARLLEGLSWKGLALVALLCLLNGVRRAIRNFPDDRLGDWVARVVEVTGLGLVIALPITFAVVATLNRAPASRWGRILALAFAIVGSSMLGVFVSIELETLMLARPGGLLQIWPRYALLAALVTTFYVYYRDAEASAARASDAELDRARLGQQMNEARLQVLQAQIEPHFLFNTLATVRRLYQTAPAAAAAMLDNLMRYLTVALPQMRASDSTLGRELALAEAYLAVQKVRMERRLIVEVDVPQALLDARVPPMMLLTLVENAVKHGLTPLLEGGTLRISAKEEEGRLQLEVADSGQGFVQLAGTGTGLANIRSRLAAAYGALGRLALSQNRPRGITASISIPLVRAAT